MAVWNGIKCQGFAPWPFLWTLSLDPTGAGGGGLLQPRDRLAGLVVRRPPRERKIPGSNPACTGIFSGSSHTSDSKIGTPVATLPGAWRYRVSAGTGRPGVSILWLGEVESLMCNFSVWQHAHLSEQIRPWDTLACCWDVKQATNKQLQPRDPHFQALLTFLQSHLWCTHINSQANKTSVATSNYA